MKFGILFSTIFHGLKEDPHPFSAINNLYDLGE